MAESKEPVTRNGADALSLRVIECFRAGFDEANNGFTLALALEDCIDARIRRACEYRKQLAKQTRRAAEAEERAGHRNVSRLENELEATKTKLAQLEGYRVGVEEGLPRLRADLEATKAELADAAAEIAVKADLIAALKLEQHAARESLRIQELDAALEADIHEVRRAPMGTIAIAASGRIEAALRAAKAELAKRDERRLSQKDYASVVDDLQQLALELEATKAELVRRNILLQEVGNLVMFAGDRLADLPDSARALQVELESLRSKPLVERIREIADDALGLQPVDADPVALVEQLEKRLHEYRVSSENRSKPLEGELEEAFEGLKMGLQTAKFTYDDDRETTLKYLGRIEAALRAKAAQECERCAERDQL